MAIKINSLQGISAMSANGTNRHLRVNPRLIRNPLRNIDHKFQGTYAGYITGTRVPPGVGSVGYFEKFLFASDASSTNVGSLMTSSRRTLCSVGQSSETSGYTAGGYISPNIYSNVIDKFPFATDFGATDVGDLTLARFGAAGQSSNVSGYASGGYSATPPVPSRFRTTIDKFPFATNANATDVGNLSVARHVGGSQSSEVSGYTSGGYRVPQASPVINSFQSNVIDKFPFATNANATDVGDMTLLFTFSAGASSTVSGYNSGGVGRSGTPFPYIGRNIIEKFPFATDANATDVGDLTVARQRAAGVTSTDSGYSLGGSPAPVDGGLTSFIDKFPFATDANATDVGDLSGEFTSATGLQD